MQQKIEFVHDAVRNVGARNYLNNVQQSMTHKFVA